ncbi:MAG: 1-acyl-sn-glycerol-3-phosphate acyltransferase [Synechococcaceae cyanobacterium SM2_3_2]|nr:1-acyl-sn-glycerol-3-phosphate acyltransferase [Synechococcaceae cyanobacterium SM2_3_2]
MPLPLVLPQLTLPDPLAVAQSLLQVCQTEVRVEGRQHLPAGAAIVVSNHRSFLDAPVLIAALGQPIQLACHYYLSQVPGLREVALGLGCIPLKQGSRNQVHFFRAAENQLRQGSSVGLFPEGARRIACVSSPTDVGDFQAGFVHLALKSRIRPLPIVPVAIYAQQEWRSWDIPLSVFRWFDITEPMFQADGGHPVVIYRQVAVRILPPIWMPSEPSTRGELLEQADEIATEIRTQIQVEIRALGELIP